MTRKKIWHVMAHVGLIALQGVNAAAPFVPPPYNAAVAAGLAIVQGALAVNGWQAEPKPQAIPAEQAKNVETQKAKAG